MRFDQLSRLGRRDRAPRIPGDLEDHERDRETDDRVANARAERDHDRARDDAQRNEAVDAGVIAVGDQRRTRQPPARAQPYLRGQLVTDEADDAGRRQHPEMRQVLRMDQTLDRLVQRDTSRDEDCEHDR